MTFSTDLPTDNFLRVLEESASRPHNPDLQAVNKAYGQGDVTVQEVERDITSFRQEGFTPQQMRQRLLIGYYAAAYSDPEATRKISYIMQHFPDKK